MTPYFSIIVPVYNVEAYISTCIESVQAQTFSDFELLFVDDCGTDGSMQIVESYAKGDKRIRVLHHEHGGAASARNVGFHYASGKYIVLLDGDDFLERHHLERVFACLDGKTCDMCISNNYIRYWPEKEEVVELFPFSEELNRLPLEKQIALISNPNYHMPTSAWLTIYSRSFLKEYELLNSEELTYNEDADFFLAALAVAEKILFTDHKFYYYRQNNTGATTKNMTDRNYADNLSVFAKWIDFYNDSAVGYCLIRAYRGAAEESIRVYHSFKGHEELKKQLASNVKWWGRFPGASYGVNLSYIRLRNCLSERKKFLKRVIRHYFGGVVARKNKEK